MSDRLPAHKDQSIHVYQGAVRQPLRDLPDSSTACSVPPTPPGPLRRAVIRAPARAQVAGPRASRVHGWPAVSVPGPARLLDLGASCPPGVARDGSAGEG